MVESLLSAAQLRLVDLDALAVGRGPGGFTGVRLAIGVAQGLAFGANKPVVAVSDLRAIAQRAFELEPAARHCTVCADARMREVYAGRFVRGASGLAVPAAPVAETVLSPDAVVLPDGAAAPDAVARAGTDFGVLAGRGFRAYPELGQRARGTGLPLFDDLLPGAVQIATLAVADAAQGAAVPASQLRPVYLRDQVAQPSVRT
ncbi:MAG: tRNA (adenosine(37)-N6)-threonylcarbamoyltransferase complex dimerization subunit type 1 TsaB [Steroidobacteraceae bacterium]